MIRSNSKTDWWPGLQAQPGILWLNWKPENAFQEENWISPAGIKGPTAGSSRFYELVGDQRITLPLLSRCQLRQQKTGISCCKWKASFELAILLSNWTQDTVIPTWKILHFESSTGKIKVHGIGVVESEIRVVNHEQRYLTSLLFKMANGTC